MQIPTHCSKINDKDTERWGPGWISGGASAFGQGVILESRDPVPHGAPPHGPASPSAWVSAFAYQINKVFLSNIQFPQWHNEIKIFILC